MNLENKEYDDEPQIEIPREKLSKEQIENRERTLQEFLDALKTESEKMQSEKMQRIFRAERPKSPREGEVFEGIPTEKVKEQERENRESTSRQIWERIRSEGVNKDNLKGFLDNVRAFIGAELSAMAASIDDLLREWDPSLHGFLRNLQSELKAMARLKETEQK